MENEKKMGFCSILDIHRPKNSTIVTIYFSVGLRRNIHTSQEAHMALELISSGRKLVLWPQSFCKRTQEMAGQCVSAFHLARSDSPCANFFRLLKHMLDTQNAKLRKAQTSSRGACLKYE